MVTRVFQLTCDEKATQCDHTSYFSSLELAKRFGWIISADHLRCTCPACALTFEESEESTNG